MTHQQPGRRPQGPILTVPTSVQPNHFTPHLRPAVSMAFYLASSFDPSPSPLTEIKVNSVETCHTCFKPANNFLYKLLTEVYRPSKIYSLKASPVLFLFVPTKHPLRCLRAFWDPRPAPTPHGAQWESPQVSLTPSPLSSLLTRSFTTLLQHLDLLCDFN